MSESLNVVLKVRAQSVKTASQHLQHAEQELQLLKEQVSALEVYAVEYQKQLSNEGLIGVQQRQLLVAYLGQVQSAVLGQYAKISETEKKVIQARDIWLEARLKEQAIEKLIDKRTETALRVENLKEQLASDALNQVRFVLNRQALTKDS